MSKGGPTDAELDAAMVEQRRGAIIPSFDYRVDYCATTLRGGGKAINQDALLCRPKLGLFAIADGMGGHAAGEVAAQLSLEAIESYLAGATARDVIDAYAAAPDLAQRRAVYGLIEQAMEKANDVVMQAGEEDASRQGMGTTLDLVLLVRDRAFFAHVGDSRAYLVRPTATLQLTHDHAAYDSLRTSGKRATNPAFARSPLTNSIGHRRRLVVDTLFVDLGTRDRIVLSTDGAFNGFQAEASFAKLCRRGDTRAVCRALMAACLRQGVLDDATVITLEIRERFAKRQSDAGPRSRDIATISASPLLIDLPTSSVLSTLAAGVEVELDEGQEVPRAVANDRVAYVILEGLVELPNGRKLGPSGLLMVESLLDVPVRGQLPKVLEHARLLRVRYDDFTEVCAHNTQLAAELYKRIAVHLAR